MVFEMRKPAPVRAGDGLRKLTCLAAVDPTINPLIVEIQHRRAAFLARRYRVPCTMASVVAALAFGEVRQ